MKAMADEEKELSDLFLKSFGTLPSVDSISGPTNSSSVGKRGSWVESESLRSFTVTVRVTRDHGVHG